MTQPGCSHRAPIDRSSGWYGVGTMTTLNSGSPTPIHRALDRLTASKLELQVLRRQAQLGEPIDLERLVAQLVQVDGWLDEVAAVLTDEREQKTESEVA